MKRVLLSLCTLTVAMGLSFTAQAGPKKCPNLTKTLAKATASAKAAGAALKACKSKYKRTHLLRCRKQHKAFKAASKNHKRVARFHGFCTKGCSDIVKRIAGLTKAHAAAHTAWKACKAKNKKLSLIKCRKESKALKSLNKKLKRSRRKLAVCKGGCKFLKGQAAAAAAANKACRKKYKWTGRVRCLKIKLAASKAAKRAAACIPYN